MAPSNASGRNLESPTALPAWNRKETHPCEAFQTITGEKTRIPTAAAIYGPGFLSQTRPVGSTMDYKKTPAGRKTA